MATIGILQERAVAERAVVAGQLQVPLNSRVVIEQLTELAGPSSAAPLLSSAALRLSRTAGPASSRNADKCGPGRMVIV